MQRFAIRLCDCDELFASQDFADLKKMYINRVSQTFHEHKLSTACVHVSVRVDCGAVSLTLSTAGGVTAVRCAAADSTGTRQGCAKGTRSLAHTRMHALTLFSLLSYSQSLSTPSPRKVKPVWDAPFMPLWTYL
jgi:hypothetical protein